MDRLLHLELHWHAELVGVVVAVAEGRCLYLSDLLDFDSVLEYLVLVEILLGHMLHFVDMPWRADLLQHCLDEGSCH